MKVLIIEDHPASTIGIEYMLKDNFEDVEYFSVTNGKDAIKKLNETAFDVVTLDIELPDTDSNAFLYDVKRIQPDCKVLVYTNHQAEIYAMRYLKMGASGFLNKSNTEQAFVLAIQVILTGQLCIPKEVMNMNTNGHNFFENSNPFNELSKREFELFSHIIKGEKMKDICKILNIEQSTSATLKRRIMAKLGVKNMVELVAIAIEHGYKK